MRARIGSYQPHSRIRQACVIALVALAPAMTAAQSGANPFGRVPLSQLNALRIWDQLPPQIKQSIQARVAPLTDEQRRQLLTSIPALRNLTSVQIDAILTQLEATIPLPETEVLTASFEGQSGNYFEAWKSNFNGLKQTFTANESGLLTKVAVNLVALDATRPIGDTWLSVYEIDASGNHVNSIVKAASITAADLPPFTIGKWIEIDATTLNRQIVAGNRYEILLFAADRDYYLRAAPSWVGDRFPVGGESAYAGGEGSWMGSGEYVVDYAFRVTVKK